MEEMVDDIQLQTADVSEDITGDLELAGQLTGVVAGVESIIETIKRNGVGDRRALAYVHLAVKAELSPLGLEKLYVCPSFENYDDLSEQQIIASLEDITVTLEGKLGEFASKTWKKISDFFMDFVEDMGKLSVKASELKSGLSSINATPASDFIRISQADYLHLSGKTDPNSIIKGYENLTKANKEFTPTYLANVKTFYTAYFKAFQAIAGKADMLEKMETGGKLADNFIQTVKRDLDKVLDTGDGRVEMSGGVILKSRNIVIEGLPDLMKKNPSLKVDSIQSIKTPSIQEMEHLLSLIEENGQLVKSQWGRFKETMKIISDSRADAAIESNEIDGSAIRKLLSRVHSHFTSIMIHGSVMQPITLLSWHTVHTTRSLLKLCEKAITVHRSKE
jgi:hypothetical protein